MGDIKNTWKVNPKSEYWCKTWLRYDLDGREVGAMIIVENGTPELIEAIKAAFDTTEGEKAT